MPITEKEWKEMNEYYVTSFNEWLKSEAFKKTKEPIEEKCGNCKFYKLGEPYRPGVPIDNTYYTDSINPKAICVRFPPSDGGTWSYVHETRYCGEFKAK